MIDKSPVILVIDDVPLNIKVLINILETDYDVLFATNGQNGYEIACRELPDLILLDVLMPEFDGYQTCQLLKENPLTRHIPVIFVTSLANAADEAIGLQMGAIDYLSKPVNPAIVKIRVKNHLELKQARDLLERISTIDELTGIANRRRFDEFLLQSWRAMLREARPLSLIMIDIDYFKQYNDYYGHLKGDHCLQQVARALTQTVVRPADLAARYGGEEFVCILPGADLTGGTRVAENLREAVAALRIEHRGSNTAKHITVSLGVASATPVAGITCKELLAQADQALYQAKQSGRNKVGVMAECITAA